MKALLNGERGSLITLCWKHVSPEQVLLGAYLSKIGAKLKTTADRTCLEFSGFVATLEHLRAAGWAQIPVRAFAEVYKL